MSGGGSQRRWLTRPTTEHLRKIPIYMQTKGIVLVSTLQCLAFSGAVSYILLMSDHFCENVVFVFFCYSKVSPIPVYAIVTIQHAIPPGHICILQDMVSTVEVLSKECYAKKDGAISSVRTIGAL